MDNNEGKITTRECTDGEFNWRRGTDFFGAADNRVFNEEFQDSMFTTIDLWGPFYPDDQTEFVIISEFNRIRGD